jgi:hypothetical protein
MIVWLDRVQKQEEMMRGMLEGDVWREPMR